MARTIYTPDGKCHIVLRTDDLYAVIVEYVGKDAMSAIADHIGEIGDRANEVAEDLRERIDDLNDDIDKYENVFRSLKKALNKV